jgi:hypothetical protein
MWTVAYHYSGQFCDYLDVQFTLEQACHTTDKLNKKYGGGYVAVPLSFARREI